MRSVASFQTLALLALAPCLPLRAGAPVQSITAVASLTDPAKLHTLTGKRSANDRLHKILAWLEEARRAGMHPGKTIDEAQKITADSPVHAALVKEMLLRNFEQCERSAVFTDDNLLRMKQGHAPLVVSGTYKDQPYEVDHIIPVAEFPALGNELANLIYLPRTLNRRKSDDIKQRALDLGQRLTAAGVLTKSDYARLHEIRVWGSSPEPSPSPPDSLSSTPRPPKPADPSASPPVNLNTATAAELATLPGIGPKTAEQIIRARPLKDFDALNAVPGIGLKKIEALRDLVSF